MFAVIKTGGKQYRVAENDLLQVERLAGEAGDMVELPHVLMVGDGAGATIGAPMVEGALVTAEIVGQTRTRKVLSFKKRRRQNSKRIRGHRQMLTEIRISEILTGGAKPSKKAAAKKPAAKDAPAAETSKAEKPARAADKKTADKAEIVDDVALIGGVGPALKKKLAGAGLTSRGQIAGLSADDIARLDEELKLGGRIERDEWKEQAAELLAGKPPRAKVDKAAAADKKAD
ncbi:MAG: 50S ribosomal protein L21 [Pseudomonadota bacterium]|nr:50S ribosomal protein L21 [Pseudomonadota bacterium]